MSAAAQIPEIAQQLAQIVQRLGNIAALAPEQDYFDAGLKSIQALELLAEVEAAFEVTLPDEEYAKVRNVRDLAGLVASARAGNAA